jgi:vacuolar-type H+-ATPase subunit I/STV1
MVERYFDNQIFMLSEIQESINYLLEHNGRDAVDEWDHVIDFNKAIIKEFKTASDLLDRVMIYLQRIDSLVIGEEDEEEFIENLKRDLNELKYKL